MLITDESAAIHYTASVLRTASDWQEGEQALINHSRFGPWLREECGGDELAMHSKAQYIVSKAEERLGDQLPY